MAKTRIALELGMGTSLRRHDYTEAACRAVKDALWHNSVSFAEAFGFEKSDMLIEVEMLSRTQRLLFILTWKPQRELHHETHYP
jgi:hypothetical protein